MAHRLEHFELVRSMVARGLGYSLFLQRPRNPTSYEGLPIVVRGLDAGRRPTLKAQRMVELALRLRGEFAPPAFS